jgi:hypothetical protein
MPVHVDPQPPDAQHPRDGVDCHSRCTSDLDENTRPYIQFRRPIDPVEKLRTYHEGVTDDHELQEKSLKTTV